MRAVVQKVTASNVSVDGEVVGKINSGLLVLLGVGEDDEIKDVDYMVDKIVNLRIFEDENEKLNLSLLDVGGELLVVSQFTLFGDCRKGRRPGFSDAARPDKADEFYIDFVEKAKAHGINVQTGKFRTHMMVELINDGPVTLLIDSKKNF
ncbi:D-aminoacyl-tRNA deacylase [Peptostreptococcus porci]|uniref:D-aminoacyl-tRNA deacylase n=1 Tax=Peptostreptococcus porci TaxID=2652282 RepID=A0A6N7WYH0_9FIRM|nr:D-aminoacyl-tRNA deacylase [Peptostreptococcus porci]MDD7184000.1 D-aminoacyl-tRNA deacylase [Peptostreptococcus porci]MDY2795301.1 D-aminoacyl-tRNA deacylase [Peptostreptococcus porci]MDY4129365.1 D-aminoacyl-tRNA deacylase [Peptostreptococcus porci]MDY4561792.1 D-aminoacyl-tRNA deacylase [Peptostreptococcus porci]MDY5435761.1 D-aminoacyl-tRNA deacylase [Peptostreptococcus porci]